ncbi:SGNH/GDSL hydrolase family protein, partial [Acinetobacter baumannii]
YTILIYTDFLLQEAHHFIQELSDQGATRVGVVGLPAMGCLPVVITLYSDNPILKRNCIESFNTIARDYNQKLQNNLKTLQLQLQGSGSRIAYLDICGPILDLISGRGYAFDEVSHGCCGTGMLEASFMCNRNMPVCADASKYMFWDSIHPTEKMNELIFQALRPDIDGLVKN